MEWIILPAVALFAQPVADTRSSLPVVLLRWDPDFSIDATLGNEFPLLEYGDRDRGVQFGIDAAGFMGFDPGDGLTFELETFDGIFGFPLTGRWGPWSARLEWSHTSAHFADGIRNNGELPGNAGSYSREWVRFLGGWRTGPARVYAGGRAVTHDAYDAQPVGLQVGGEVVGDWVVAPFVAVDLQASSEFGWAPELSGQAGAAVQAGPRRLRVALAGRYGKEDTGKLAGQDEAWLGLIFGFDAFGLGAPRPGVD